MSELDRPLGEVGPDPKNETATTSAARGLAVSKPEGGAVPNMMTTMQPATTTTAALKRPASREPVLVLEQDISPKREKTLMSSSVAKQAMADNEAGNIPPPEAEADLLKNLLERGRRNDIAAMNEITSIFLRQGQDKKAYKWALKATSAGSVVAEERLGVMLLTGKGVLMCPLKGAMHCASAAASGSDSAAFILGNIYQKGIFGWASPDLGAAKYWLEKCLGDCAFETLSDSDKADARRSLDELAAGSRTHSTAILGESLLFGKTEQIFQGLVHSAVSAAEGSALGAYNLGKILKEGRPGFPKDNTESIRWLEKCLDHHNRGAFTLSSKEEKDAQKQLKRLRFFAGQVPVVELSD